MVKVKWPLACASLVLSSYPWLGTIAEQPEQPIHTCWQDCQVFCFLSRHCWIFTFNRNWTQNSATVLSFCITVFLKEDTNSGFLSWKLLIIFWVWFFFFKSTIQCEMNNKEASSAIKFTTHKEFKQLRPAQYHQTHLSEGTQITAKKK